MIHSSCFIFIIGCWHCVQVSEGIDFSDENARAVVSFLERFDFKYVFCALMLSLAQ